ncbi:hypothetical protein [Pseudoalteromonas sp. MTN2-4]|uniref:hypothetical protein n=1 Tax=Pseudoalteromonas sp. MTN2-4 TaxID=3056555 RepID=UPI0036F2FD72
MRPTLALLTLLTLSACGSGGGKNEPTNTQTQNQSPVVTISGEDQTLSLNTLRLTTNITEPEGESVIVEWSSDHAGVSFKDASENGVLVQMPTVSEDQEISVTVKVTDSANNTVSKSFTILVKALPDSAQIDLRSSYEFLAGELVTVTAKYSIDENIDDLNWQLSDLTVNDMDVSTFSRNGVAQSTVQFTAPDVTDEQAYTLSLILDAASGQISRSTQLTILPKTADELVVNLDAVYEGNENDQMLIKPIIQTSDRVVSYQWRWLDKSLGELVGETSKDVVINTQAVEKDEIARLALDVETQGGVKKSIETQIKVKNVVQTGGLSLAVNRVYAAPGQTVTVQVSADNTNDIESYEWRVDEEVFTQKTESATELSLVMPNQDISMLSTLVNYKATFKNGVEVEKQAIFALMSESAIKATLDIEQSTDLPQLYKNETLTFNALAIDKAGVLDSVALDVSNVSYADLDTATLTQDGLNLSFTLKASDILLDRELMLRVVMNAGTVSTTEYVSVNLNKSNLKLFAGSEKTYISGSDFYVFGYGQERLNNPINAMSWSTNYDGLAIEALNSSDAKITNETTSSFPTVTLSARDSEDQLIQADVRTNMTSRIYDKGERYTCYFRANEVLCRDNSNTLLDVGELAAPVKAGVTKGEFVCLLNNDDQLSCHGEGPLSVLEVPERAGVANIVAVSNSDMCAQYSSGNWQCWGEQADYFNNLFVGKSHIDNLIGTQQGVCLVNSGYIECYNDKSEQIYQDKRSFVKSLEFVNILNKVCYTTERSTLRTCPDEIN